MRKKTGKNGRCRARLERELTCMERQILVDLRQHLARAASTSSGDATEFMDIVSDSELDDLAARIAESDSLKVDEIEDALALLREGRYGTCRSCGTDIPPRRLKALPSATLCLQCKEQQERRRAGRHVPAYEAANAEVDVDLGLTDSESDYRSADGLMEETNIREMM